MTTLTLFRPTLLVTAVALFAACASAPAQDPASPATRPVAATPSTAPATPEATTEAEAATLLEKRFQEAARGYKQVQKDGKTMYCKREKVIGSTIPTMQCMTESQLRIQVESMEELRGRMRSGGRCTLGPGCKGD